MTSVTPKPGRTPLFVVYSPWKSFSTGFLEYLRDHAGAFVIKEVFHENRYEARPGKSRMPVQIEDGDAHCWPRLAGSAAPWKYKLDDSALSGMDRMMMATALGDIVAGIAEARAARPDQAIVVQIAESRFAANLVAEACLAGGVGPVVRVRADLDTECQARAIFHTFLDGNDYFVANLLLFYLLNLDRDATITQRLPALSATGALELCSRFCRFMPRPVVVALISLYQALMVEDRSRYGDGFEPANAMGFDRARLEYDATSIRQRYAYLDEAGFRHMDRASSEAAVREFMHRFAGFEVSGGMLGGMMGEKRVFPKARSSQAVLWEMSLDRLFVDNCDFVGGGLSVIDPAEPLDISAALPCRAKVRLLVASTPDDAPVTVREAHVGGRIVGTEVLVGGGEDGAFTDDPLLAGLRADAAASGRRLTIFTVAGGTGDSVYLRLDRAQGAHGLRVFFLTDQLAGGSRMPA